MAPKVFLQPCISVEGFWTALVEARYYFTVGRTRGLGSRRSCRRSVVLSAVGLAFRIGHVKIAYMVEFVIGKVHVVEYTFAAVRLLPVGEAENIALRITPVAVVADQAKVECRPLLRPCDCGVACQETSFPCTFAPAALR